MNHQDHPALAAAFNKDFERTTWHDETLWFVRQKRDKAVYPFPEFQDLRALASEIKDHTLSNLDNYLLQFEENARKNGVNVHWAADATEHNQIVMDIIKQSRPTEVQRKEISVWLKVNQC